MHRFQNILYVTFSPGVSSAALEEALDLARTNGARLTVLGSFPEFPEELQAYQNSFAQSMVDQLKTAKADCGGTGEPETVADQVRYEVEFGKTPAMRIIRRVLRQGHDLVVKDTEPAEGGRGFRSVDMQLLRKCPCAVWLCRPERSAPEKNAAIAVAIDPESRASDEEELALRLLRVSSSLAERCGSELHVVSCWDFEFEETLHRNPWYRVPEDELFRIVSQARGKRRGTLDDLVRKADLGEKAHVHFERGHPGEIIPSFLEKNGTDILVMGTVARTGLSGLLIGNTAEDILQKAPCSLLALKPEGFVSPVRIDD